MVLDEGLVLTEEACDRMTRAFYTTKEEQGGMGLGYVELCALFEQMGQHLLCAPFMSTVGFGVNALLVAASEEQQQQWLPAIAEGSLTATLAYSSASGGWDVNSVAVEYTESGGSFTLNGDYRYVLDGHKVYMRAI